MPGSPSRADRLDAALVGQSVRPKERIAKGKVSLWNLGAGRVETQQSRAERTVPKSVNGGRKLVRDGRAHGPSVPVVRTQRIRAQ